MSVCVTWVCGCPRGCGCVFVLSVGCMCGVYVEVKKNISEGRKEIARELDQLELQREALVCWCVCPRVCMCLGVGVYVSVCVWVRGCVGVSEEEH